MNLSSAISSASRHTKLEYATQPLQQTRSKSNGRLAMDAANILLMGMPIKCAT